MCGAHTDIAYLLILYERTLKYKQNYIICVHYINDDKIIYEKENDSKLTIN